MAPRGEPRLVGRSDKLALEAPQSLIGRKVVAVATPARHTCTFLVGFVCRCCDDASRGPVRTKHEQAAAAATRLTDWPAGYSLTDWPTDWKRHLVWLRR